MLRKTCKIKRIRNCGIPAADNRNRHAAEKCTVACCAVRNARSHLLYLSRDAEQTRLCPHSENYRTRKKHLFAAFNAFYITRKCKFLNGGKLCNKPKTRCLLLHLCRKGKSVDAFVKSGIVFHIVCFGDLAAHRHFLNQKRASPCTRSV